MFTQNRMNGKLNNINRPGIGSPKRNVNAPGTSTRPNRNISSPGT